MFGTFGRKTLAIMFICIGDGIRDSLINTVGNIVSGQVVGEIAKTLSERFRKVLLKRQSIFINRQDVSTSINT